MTGPGFKRVELADNPIRSPVPEQVELRAARAIGPPIREINDVALAFTVDGGMWLLNETIEPFGMPMVAAGLPSVSVHALLNHCPMAIVGDKEAMQVEIKAVLNCGAVNLRDEAAGARQRRTVKAHTVAKALQLFRGLARMLPAPTADMEPKLAAQRSKPAFQRADNAGGYAG